MTAFARVRQQGTQGEFTWELRSVNHRYLEQTLRLPDALREHELEFRKRIGSRLGRGKVDATLRFTPVASREALQIDTVLVERLADALHRVATELGGIRTDPPDLFEILRWPGVILSGDAGSSDALLPEALASLDEALQRLVGARAAEGAQLKAVLLERVAGLEARCETLRERLPRAVTQVRTRLHERLAELAARVDADRLEQEIVLAAQKMDIAEELDRLTIHLAEIRKALDADRPVGRHLDFLIQELNRETNTIASKSGDAAISQTAVDMKVLVEQMREQVQNLE